MLLPALGRRIFQDIPTSGRETEVGNMALLRRKSETPVATLERDLSNLTTRREALSQKLATARTALAIASNERRMAMLDADLDDETAATRRDSFVRDARDQVEALADAVVEINSRISDAETKLASARDHAERAELAAGVRADADVLHDSALELAAVGIKVEAALNAIASRVPLAPDFVPRVCAYLHDLPEAVDQAVGTAAEYANQISGGAPIHRAAPAPAPAPVVEPIERMQIYTLQNLSWREGAQTFTRPRYAWATPPRHLAIAACERNLADVPGSVRTEKLNVRHQRRAWADGRSVHSH
jgi:predicted  nucleic acid-binding Zn-ribbon protein